MTVVLVVPVVPMSPEACKGITVWLIVPSSEVPIVVALGVTTRFTKVPVAGCACCP